MGIFLGITYKFPLLFKTPYLIFSPIHIRPEIKFIL